MSEKPIYKSKKVALAVGGIATNVIIAALPSVLNLEPSTVKELNDLAYWIIPTTLLLLGGHSLQDALTTAKGWQAPPQEINIAEAQPQAE